MKRTILGLYAAVTVALMVWGYHQAIYVAPEEQTIGPERRDHVIDVGL